MDCHIKIIIKPSVLCIKIFFLDTELSIQLKPALQMGNTEETEHVVLSGSSHCFCRCDLLDKPQACNDPTHASPG